MPFHKVSIKKIKTMQSIMVALGGASSSKERSMPSRVALKDRNRESAKVEKKEPATSSADMGGMAMKEEASMRPTAFMAKTMLAEAMLISK